MGRIATEKKKNEKKIVAYYKIMREEIESIKILNDNFFVNLMESVSIALESIMKMTRNSFVSHLLKI